MITKVALDLDGVLANFTKAACKKCGVLYPVDPKKFEENWLDEKTKDILWKNCRGHDFWAEIEPFPWANEIVKIVNNNCADWRFITKPSFDPGSYSGKFDWVRMNFKDKIRHLWLVNGSKAYACTGPEHLLIDDNKKNCQEWRDAGGTVFEWEEVTPNWPQYDIAKSLDELKKVFLQ